MGKKEDVNAETKKKIIVFLLQDSKNGKPAYGKMIQAVTLFQVSYRSIKRLWFLALAQKNAGNAINLLNYRRGRIVKKKHGIDYQRIEQIDVHKRGTIQGMSDALGIPKSIVGRWSTSHMLRPHTNAIKPLLTAPNKLARLSFSVQALQLSLQDNKLQFKCMENTVHIDEKWFYLSRKTHRFYLRPMEADPLRVTQSKNFIPKVMFMCAVSRPVFGVDGQCIFDGKIGIWPFVEEVTAQRNSKKRPKGTKELKHIQSITREVIKRCIINQIIPAIKHKCPPSLSKRINIQQDNARTHIKTTDADFQTDANADGFQIILVQQPPNSPDCNTLDLGFFSAIQSFQQRIKCKDADELIKAVHDSFLALEPMTLNKVFLSLQCVLVEIMQVRGANNYKLPHMNKNSLLRQGLLPNNLQVQECLVRDCIDFLIREDFTEGIGVIMELLGINPPHNGDGIPDLNL